MSKEGLIMLKRIIKKVARCFNELVDLKLKDPGAVKIVFNPINKEGLSNVKENNE